MMHGLSKGLRRSRGRWGQILALAFGLAAVLAGVTAEAGTLVYTDTTVGKPTWNRPVAGNPPTPPPSGVGTAVRFHVAEITVDQTGAYDFLSLGVTPTNWDNFLFLYQTSFNPAAQFTNVIIGNDDFPSIGRSGFNGVTLTAGVTYFVVTTGFANTDAGVFTNTITGPGNITLVPEPASIALMAGGLVLVGFRLRPRAKSRTAA